MANVNTQLRENPVLQRMPTNQREWRSFANELTKWVADLDTSGRLSSDKNMPQVLLGNMGSVQTSIPMTATDAGASATINIAAHTVSRQSMSVDYNSGSVTALAYNTKYYIYVDDPNFEGGSVTYLSTTDKADIMGDVGRYFVGEIKTPVAAGSDKTGAVGAGFAVLEDDLAAFGEVQSGEPTYTTSGVTPTRTYTFSGSGTGSGIAVNDASTTLVARQADFVTAVQYLNGLTSIVGTIIEDLQSKNVFGD